MSMSTGNVAVTERRFVAALICYIHALYFAAHGYWPTAPVLAGKAVEVATNEVR